MLKWSGRILIILIGAKSVQVTEIREPNRFESVVQCPNEAPRARAAEFPVVWSAPRARKALSSADYWPGRTENDEPPGPEAEAGSTHRKNLERTISQSCVHKFS